MLLNFQPEENSELAILKDQNNRLKEVVKQMSSDFQNLAAQNRTQASYFSAMPVKCIFGADNVS